MKRYLYLGHRWLGIALCLLLALWFASGMVMLYVGYPKLTPAEHLRPLPPLAPDCCPAVADLLPALRLASLRLTSIAGQPRYLAELSDGSQLAFDGRSGQPVAAVDAALALASARQFGAGVAADYLGLVPEDTWSHARALDRHRPLHLVELHDAAATRLYLSSVSGEVLLDSSRSERAWNWLGAWLHWLYALRGGPLDGAWRVLVIGLALGAGVMSLLGLVLGVLRWRRRPYRSGSHSPYPPGWLRWHHLGGLGLGLLLLAWTVSGLLSMRPWGLLEQRSRLSPADYRGGALQSARLTLPVTQALALLDGHGLAASELEWRRIAGEDYLLAWSADGDSRILRLGEQPRVFAMLPEARLLAAAQGMAPDTPIQAEWLRHFDFHYFARAEQSMYGAQRRPLPVLRVRFADAAATWVHLDPRSGALLEQSDRSRRAGRWLFNLLHSWDAPALLARPQLRQGLIIAASLGGLLLSLSGVVIGWRRLRRQFRSTR